MTESDSSVDDTEQLLRQAGRLLREAARTAGDEKICHQIGTAHGSVSSAVESVRSDDSDKMSSMSDTKRSEVGVGKGLVARYINSGGSLDDPLNDFDNWLRSDAGPEEYLEWAESLADEYTTGTDR